MFPTFYSFILFLSITEISLYFFKSFYDSESRWLWSINIFIRLMVHFISLYLTQLHVKESFKKIIKTFFNTFSTKYFSSGDGLRSKLV